MFVERYVPSTIGVISCKKLINFSRLSLALSVIGQFLYDLLHLL